MRDRAAAPGPGLRAGQPIALALLASLICAASCGPKAGPHQNFPPRADLVAAPEPAVPADALVSEKAANDYDTAVLIWGRGLEAQVGRLCRWAAESGMKGIKCDEGEPGS